MFKLKEIFKWILVLVAVLVFLSFSFGSLDFKHQHILADGTVIEHSHPFSHQNGGHHQHTKNEYNSLALLMSHLSFVQNIYNLNAQIQVVNILQPIIKDEFIKLAELSQNILRGPPNC